MKAKKLLRQSYYFYGPDQQRLKAVEELNELATALMHYRDGRASTVKVAKELADVEIMCAKMRIMLGKKVCKEAKRKKLNRFATMFAEDFKRVKSDDLVEA